MTFDELNQKIKDGEQFSFARYGDGEWNAMFQDTKSKQNCDHHEYFPDMGLRLKNIIKSSPDYYLGLQNLAYKQRKIEIDNLTQEYNINWVKADILHRANIHGRIGELFDALKDKKVLLVGPPHLKGIKLFDHYFCEVPVKNCWLDYVRIYDELEVVLPMVDVVLYCCSMMANVLIDDFQDRGVTQIDLGSVLDPHVGIKSRGYHTKLMEKL